MTRQARRRVLGFALSGALAVLFALLAGAAGTVDGLEDNAIDARFEIRGAVHNPPEVAVVAIDDKTFAKLGKPWPFSRRYHARVIERLRDAGAAAIGYDVQFSEAGADVGADNRLVRAVLSSPRIVMAATEVDDDGRSNVFGGNLEVNGGVAGSANFLEEDGGVIRRMPKRVEKLDSFSYTLARMASRARPGARAVPPPPHDRSWIDYAGPPGTVRTYSFVDVLDGTFPPNAFRGRAVVVGATAPSLHDLHPTSSLPGPSMSGAELNANAVRTAMRGFPLDAAPTWLHGLLVVLMGLLAPLAAWRFSSRGAALAALAAVAAYIGGAQLAFNGGVILPVAEPLLALVASLFGVVTVQAVTNGIERQRVHETFARFVGDNVVGEVLSRSDGLRLGGVETPSTILFLDVRGFTTFSEGRPAAVVLDVLNKFLTVMSEPVLDHGGTLTTYLGDGLMAMFGAPIPQDDHADRAVAAAQAMVDRLPAFNRRLARAGHGPLDIGIGLHSGAVMSGMVGSERRLEYTAIGDVVNCASRLEGLTKGSGFRVLISEDTRLALKQPIEGLVDAGEREIRGRTAPMQTWGLGARVAPEAGAGLVAERV